MGEQVRATGASSWRIDDGREEAESHTRDDVSLSPDGCAWVVTGRPGEKPELIATDSRQARHFLGKVVEAKQRMAHRRHVRPVPKPGAEREATIDRIDPCPTCKGEGWPDCEGCWGRGWVWREDHDDTEGD